MRAFDLILLTATLTLQGAWAGQPPPPASAESSAPATSGLVSEFMDWISERTGDGLKPCPLPRVNHTTSAEIARKWYGWAMPEGHVVKVLALYEHPQKTIYLSSAFDADALLDKSVLLHEVVHMLQHCNGIAFECHAASEPQAYELQAKWLEEQGVDDPWGSMGIDRFTVFALSICYD